jgi:hypothetical protein
MTSSEPLQRYVLHHRVHEFWAQTKLCFIRLGFVVYNQEEIAVALDELLNMLDCSSYAVYELLGEYDILVRAWISVDRDKTEVMDAIQANLLRSDLDQSKVDVLFVKSTDRHWVFCGDDGVRLEPSDKRLEALPSPEESLRINRTLASEEDGLSDDAIDDLLGEGVLGRLVHSEELDIREVTTSAGIKFVTFIRTKVLVADERRRLRNYINSRIQTLAVLVDDHQQRLVGELSLYWTPHEPQTEFVILGRIRPESFHRAIADLVEFVIDPAMRIFGAHPVTNMFARPDFVFLKEALPASMVGTAPLTEDESTIEELLGAPEGTRVEFKASVYVDVQRWIFSGGKPTLSEELFVDGIVRTVAAFLNSPQVGTGRLIIGAYELTQTLIRAREGSPQEVRERFAQFPEVGRSLVVGIEPDLQALQGTGRNVGDVDGLMLHIAQRLEEKLKPNGRAGALSSIDVQSHSIEGRSLLEIVVTTAAPRVWFHYAGPEGETFTIRSGNRSRDLSRDDEIDWRQRWELGGDV